jgi:hypothetical protein
MMNQSENNVSSSTPDPHRAAIGHRALMYGFVVSIIGLPIGVALRLPVVRGLAILGIAIGGIKIALRRSGM